MPPAHALRPATPDDLPFLLQLRLATMAPHFERQGRTLSLDEHQQRVEFRLDIARIVEVDGQAAGVVKLVREGRDGREWTLEQIQLLPTLHGSGLGGTLLRAAIAEARAAGAELRLGVLKSNPARRLYERHGFVVEADLGHGWTMKLA